MSLSDSTKLFAILLCPFTAMLLKESYREVIDKDEKKLVQRAIATLGWLGVMLLIWHSRKKPPMALVPLVLSAVVLGIYMTGYITNNMDKLGLTHEGAFWLLSLMSIILGVSISPDPSMPARVTYGSAMFALYFFTVIGSLSPLKYNIYSILAFGSIQLMARNYKFN